MRSVFVKKDHSSIKKRILLQLEININDEHD